MHNMNGGTQSARHDAHTDYIMRTHDMTRKHLSVNIFPWKENAFGLATKFNKCF